jgi:hypothetical protein
MDNASALPTTPQAPHQPQKRRQYSLRKAAGIRPRDDHQGRLICRQSDRRSEPPERMIERCGGLDVHQATVVACVLINERGRRPRKELRTFGTPP